MKELLWYTCMMAWFLVMTWRNTSKLSKKYWKDFKTMISLRKLRSAFWEEQHRYLSMIISKNSVTIDFKKIAGVMNWPESSRIKLSLILWISITGSSRILQNWPNCSYNLPKRINSRYETTNKSMYLWHWKGPLEQLSYYAFQTMSTFSDYTLM